MNRQRSLLSSILVLVAVPAVVSVAVTLLILSIRDGQREPDTIILPTTGGTSMISPLTQIPDAETQAASDSAGSQGQDAGGESGGDSDCENVIHVVSSGETLGSIATQYGFTIEEVAEFNESQDSTFDRDFLSIDQVVLIPVCGVPTAEPTALPTDTPVPTRNIPTPQPTATNPPAGVTVVEIARVRNAGDVTSEAVEIINRGTSVARLQGWTLVNDSGDAFEFPPLNLFPQGAVTIYSGVGENTAIDIYWGRDRAAWALGGTVRLVDADGKTHFEFEIPQE